MEKYFVYILKSDLGYSYIGQTSNLDDRLRRHNSNRSTYTKHKGRWSLIASASLPSRSEAVQLERKLKEFKNSDKAISYLKNLGLEHPDF
jgi:putative endonuclease